MAYPEVHRILVVDDDPAALGLLERHLAKAGYEVSTACDGHEAMRVVLAEAPAIIITDWNMPEMNGLELCEAVREHEGIGFIYVIIVTAHTDEDRIVAAFEGGADDYLAKPFNQKELLARVRAGSRIIKLQADIEMRNRDAHRYNAEIEIKTDQLAKANEKLHLLATTDELTGLLNRRECLKRLGAFWRAGDRDNGPLSCIMLDIDHFKTFNDTWGHAVGDMVLRETAATLQKYVRAESVPCRVGGEEFLVLCPNTCVQDAAKAAERLRKAVEAHRIKSGDDTLAVTISLGVAERAFHMGKADDLINEADDALYNAKRAGRNRVCIFNQTSAEPAETSQAASKSTPGDELHDTWPTDHAVRVMVADTSAKTRQQHRALLEAEGYSVSEATTGKDAIHKVERDPPHVVLMGSKLAGVDTPECVRRLKESPSTLGVPIIVYGEPSDADRTVDFLRAGAEQYLTLPIDPTEFVLRIGAMARLQVGRADLMRINELQGEQTRATILLVEFSRALAGLHTLEAVLERAVAVVAELTCSRRVSIMLPDEEQTQLTVARSLGIDKTIAASVKVAVGAEIAGRVYASGEPITVNTLEEAAAASVVLDQHLYTNVPLLSTPLMASEHVVGVLNVTERHDGRHFTPQDIEYVNLLCNMTAWAIHDIQSQRARDEARDSIVVAMASLAEHRDNETGRHVDRVTQFCILLAEELRKGDKYRALITDDYLSDLERSVPLHDIGKVAIPDSILLKPGALTPDEMKIMRTHAEIGTETIRSVIARAPGVAFLHMAEDIALGHHEWFDGAGYPHSLCGEDIPLSARIAAVADVYDALTSKRVYKTAMSHDRAVRIVEESSGLQFDPLIVSAFQKRERDFAKLARDLADDVPEPVGREPATQSPAALKPTPAGV